MTAYLRDDREPVIAYIPNADVIRDLEAGSETLDCFGRVAKVDEITYRERDIHGKWFVCYYVRWGENTRCSDSMKEGRLVRTVPLTGLYNSAQCDDLEAQMNAKGKWITFHRR